MNSPHPTTEHTTTSDAVMTQIKQKHLAPIPRWRFVLLNIGLWASGVAAAIVGALGVCMIIVVLKDSQWQLLSTRPHSGALIIRTLPYLWILLLVVFVYLAHKLVRHTRYGYTYAPLYILVISLCVSAVGGGVLYVSGIGNAFVSFIDDHRPPFHAMFIPQYAIFEDSAEGLLRGRVTKIISSKEFDLKDPRGEEWVVDISNASITGNIVENAIVHAAGEPEEGRVFRADVVLVMPGERGSRMMGGPGIMYFQAR
ncbi:MAG: hypothetical protein KIH62_003530 [Candidatus Kerfeldbacteria bacterium]|nr:hypothetical protein [Candidatus Kerfeldbacteria bacterium]